MGQVVQRTAQACPVEESTATTRATCCILGGKSPHKSKRQRRADPQGISLHRCSRGGWKHLCQGQTWHGTVRHCANDSVLRARVVRRGARNQRTQDHKAHRADFAGALCGRHSSTTSCWQRLLQFRWQFGQPKQGWKKFSRPRRQWFQHNSG